MGHQDGDRTVLFPELAGYGSLAEAIRALAAAQGFELRIESLESDPLGHAVAASVLRHREPVHVSAWSGQRRWSVEAGANNGLLLLGSTDELRHLPPVAHGWVRGAGLAEIGRLAEFEVLTGRFEVPDDDPARLIASQWQWVLAQGRSADWPAYLALLQAAFDEPGLRGLCPFTSHWAVSFATEFDPLSRDPGFLSLVAPGRPGERYVVREWFQGPVLAELDTPAEVVAFALDRLPGFLGPRR